MFKICVYVYVSNLTSFVHNNLQELFCVSSDCTFLGNKALTVPLEYLKNIPNMKISSLHGLLLPLII